MNPPSFYTFPYQTHPGKVSMQCATGEGQSLTSFHRQALPHKQWGLCPPLSDKGSLLRPTAAAAICVVQHFTLSWLLTLPGHLFGKEQQELLLRCHLRHPLRHLREGLLKVERLSY